MTPWTIAHQASPSMEFSRHEYWSGLPFPSPMTQKREIRRIKVLRRKRGEESEHRWPAVHLVGKDGKRCKELQVRSWGDQYGGGWWQGARMASILDVSSGVCRYAQSPSHVRLSVTLWTVVCWAPLFMGFSRQESRSGLHLYGVGCSHILWF